MLALNIMNRLYTTPTASVPGSQVDLSREGETIYGDNGYFGVICSR